MSNTDVILTWQQAMGVDEMTLDHPTNQLQPPAATKQSKVPQHTMAIAKPASLTDSLSQAETLANQCKTIDELQEVVAAFEGCQLKETATNTVFADGNAKADIMIIGEAPGADEDRQGIPFCGASGQLLDQALASIGLNRNNFYITNTIFWRPPGNRKPTPEELAICKPFLMRHIALFQPKILLLVGATAVTGLLEKNQGITKLRGNQFPFLHPDFNDPIPTYPLFHPSYLLRQPSMKRLFWQDLQLIEKAISSHSIDLESD